MKPEVFKRADGKWAWRITADNGQIIATDGGQGYSRRIDAARMVAQFVPAGGTMTCRCNGEGCALPTPRISAEQLTEAQADPSPQADPDDSKPND